MTQPEKEFEVGSFWSIDDRRAEYIGRSTTGIAWGCFKNQEDGYFASPLALATPWNPDPKPKSFEEAREEAAKYVENWSDAPFSLAKSAAMIRALQPDAPAVEFTDEWDCVHTLTVEQAAKELCEYTNAWPGGVAEINAAIEGWKKRLDECRARPAAAVAGSAEPERWLHIKSGREYTVISRAKIEATLEAAIVYAGKDGHVWVRPQAEFMDGRFEKLPPPSPPRPNPVGRDEAAERKLFAKHIGDRDMHRNPNGLYADIYLENRWQSWLASAKVQRGAVPVVVVAEVRKDAELAGYFQINGHGGYYQDHSGSKAAIPLWLIPPSTSEASKELLEVASRVHNAPYLPNRYWLADDLRRIAAKLGDSNE